MSRLALVICKNHYPPVQISFLCAYWYIVIPTPKTFLLTTPRDDKTKETLKNIIYDFSYSVESILKLEILATQNVV